MPFHPPQPPAGVSAGAFEWSASGTSSANPRSVGRPGGQSSNVGDVRVLIITTFDLTSIPIDIADPDCGPYSLVSIDTQVLPSVQTTTVWVSTVTTAETDEGGHSVGVTFLAPVTNPSVTVEEFAAPS